MKRHLSIYKLAFITLLLLCVGLAIGAGKSFADAPSLIFSGGANEFITVSANGSSSKFTEGSTADQNAVKYGPPYVKVSGSGCTGIVTVSDAVIQKGTGPGTLSGVSCGGKSIANGTYTIDPSGTTPNTPVQKAKTQINWSDVKSASLNSAGTQLTVTFKDGSSAVFYNQDPTGSKTYQPAPGQTTLDGVTLNWCPNTEEDSQSTNSNMGITLQSYSSKTTGTVDVCYDVGTTTVNQKNKSISVNTSSYTSAQGDTTPPCEASGVSLSWMFCPIINGLASAADGIYSNIVQPLLQTDPINVSNPNADPTNTYKIWSNFRIYGDICLIIILLVVVFGESIGGGLIDAYSVKKILPRLLVAAILINLSIYLVALAVDVTNILGAGIGGLIESPFTVGACHAATATTSAVNLGNGGNCFALHISGGTGDIGIAALVGGGIWAAGAAGFIEFLLLFALIPMFLTMIAIMVTVILRRGLIIFLILISPVAFVLYCLPNTEKYFRQWWDLLFKTLLVYPIIAVIFALANVLSVTIDSASTGIAKNFADFISIAALFAPLFLIPYSFRIAGGLIGSFSEFATSSRKKAHEAIKGNPNDPESWGRTTRQKVRMGNIERGLTGKALATNFIPPTNPLTSGGREQWRQNREARREADRNRAGQRYAEGDAVFQTNKGNDQYLLALANPELAERRRSQAGAAEQPAWKAAIAAARITHKSPAVRLQAANTLATTGFQFSAGQAGYNELAETIASITGVDPSDLNRDADGNIIGAKGKNAGTYANSMNYAQYAARGAGRFDLGGINNGTGYNYRAGIGKASGYTAGQSKPKTYVAGAADYLKVGLSGSELQNTGELPDLTRQVAENITSGRASVEDVLAWHNKLLDAQPGATGANQDEINKQLAAIEVLNQGPTPDTEEGLDRLARVVAGTRANRAARRASIDPNLLEDN